MPVAAKEGNSFPLIVLTRYKTRSYFCELTSLMCLDTRVWVCVYIKCRAEKERNRNGLEGAGGGVAGCHDWEDRYLEMLICLCRFSKCSYHRYLRDIPSAHNNDC
jgi:hypothetical protein